MSPYRPIRLIIRDNGFIGKDQQRHFGLEYFPLGDNGVEDFIDPNIPPSSFVILNTPSTDQYHSE